MIVVYARFSKEDKAFSITSQLREIQEYCAATNIKADRVFADDDVRGTLLPHERPAMAELWNLLHTGKITDIIAIDASRIARDIGVADFIWKEIFYYDAKLHLTTWERSLRDTPKDRNDFLQESIYADTERRKIKERTMRGRKDKALDGIILGQSKPPYGYAKEGTKRSTRFYIVEDESRVVQLIYDLFVNDGLMIKEIVDTLNEKNVPSPSQGHRLMWNAAKWHHDAVLRILRDPRFTGVFYALKHIIDKKTGKQVLRDKEQQVRQYFPELAIIDADVFSAAQDIINSRKHRYTFLTTHEYLFNKRLWCACEHKIGVQTMARNGNVHQYYRCQHKRKIGHGNSDCEIPYMDSKRIDFDAWMKIEAFIRSPEIVLQELRDAQQAQQIEHKEAVMTIEALDRIKKEHTAKLNKLYNDYDEGIIPKEVYMLRKQPIDDTLKRAEILYQEQQQTLDQKVLSDRQIKHIAAECSTMSDLLDEIGVLEFKHKKHIVDLLNITGAFTIVDGYIVLTLYVHKWKFDQVVIQDQKVSSIPLIEYNTSCTAAQSPITLRINVGKLRP